MNEIILLIVFTVVLLGSQFLSKKIRKPNAHYIKIFTAILLMILIWLFDKNGHYGPKIILSALALSVVFKEYFLLRKFQVNR
jgi:hypothetical protein